jgi:uncharacterized protein (TIGR02271 family)
MADDFDQVITTIAESGSDGRELVVPLYAEELLVSKRLVPTNRVQVSRVTQQHEQLVDELLARERVAIDRTVLDKPVDSIPTVREEGDTIIVPIVEEVLVVERRLILKEEVRIRRLHEEERHQERVTLRKQEAIIERFPINEQPPMAADK